LLDVKNYFADYLSAKKKPNSFNRKKVVGVARNLYLYLYSLFTVYLIGKEKIILFFVGNGTSQLQIL